MLDCIMSEEGTWMDETEECLTWDEYDQLMADVCAEVGEAQGETWVWMPLKEGWPSECYMGTDL